MCIVTRIPLNLCTICIDLVCLAGIRTRNRVPIRILPFVFVSDRNTFRCCLVILMINRDSCCFTNRFRRNRNFKILTTYFRHIYGIRLVIPIINDQFLCRIAVSPVSGNLDTVIWLFGCLQTSDQRGEGDIVQKVSTGKLTITFSGLF